MGAVIQIRVEKSGEWSGGAHRRYLLYFIDLFSSY
jgi:hypothetical protein